ncbi:hypothetical protein [Microbacterium sp.]|jgi:hypothetical protein|uniref:hypothetical protein n=1 Tax=Microbacterium sp. TaxID=51671 RepID=UPI002FE2902F
MSAKAPTAPEFESAGTDATPEEKSAPAEALYERVDLDRYAVLSDGPIGYVEWVSPVFVCYFGSPYLNSEEIAQTHDFHEAVQVVLDRAAAVRLRKRAL